MFLQHRHNGEKSWLGLNDISTEGSFTWADRGAGNFTAWAKNQPNNFREEDCVHALGMEHNYEWNDVQCSDCHQYTCKKGKRQSCTWIESEIQHNKTVTRRCQIIRGLLSMYNRIPLQLIREVPEMTVAWLFSRSNNCCLRNCASPCESVFC